MDQQQRVRRRTPWRWIRALLTVATVSALVAAAGASPARAEAWPIDDRLENNPATRWWLAQSGGGGANLHETQASRSAPTFAQLQSFNGWAEMGRQVTLDPSSGVRTCSASIHAWAPDEDTTFALEIIDAATRNYISYTTATVTGSDGVENYRRVDFGGFLHRSTPFVVRIHLESWNDVWQRVFLDDFQLTCSRPLG